MTLTKGTNCGFVTVRPTADPSATSVALDTRAMAGRFDSPGAVNVSEIGWYCDNATEAANYQVGLYSHDAVNNMPDALLVSSGDVAKGTTSGWKYAAVDIDISASTIYWIAVQLDDTATTTNANTLAKAGEKRDYKTSQTSLPATWGITDITTAHLFGIYALYTAPPLSTNLQVNIGDVWKDVTGIQINIGDVWKTVTKVEVNIGDVWKTVYSA